jgi:chromosomal replication initiation ATPase DnaA
MVFMTEQLTKGCEFLQVPVEEMIRRNRKSEVADKRLMLMAVLYKITNRPKEVGRRLNRSQQMVNYAKWQVQDLCQTDPAFKERYQELEKAIA